MYLWIYDAVLLISAFIFAVAATGGAYALMRKLEIVDIPNERSNHSQPTPRGGGLGIVFASVAFLIVADAPGSLIWGIILLAGLSFWDDLHGVCAKKRLIAQVIISAWAVFSSYEGHVLAGILPQWTEMLLLTFALVWFLNLFNFMDGSDGLAASESICISLGILAIAAIAVVSVQLTSFALIALGASLGFILWNWSPAKTFMGDVGSIPLGFFLGILLIMLVEKGFWGAALILPAVFVADATMTLFRRALKGEKLLQAHSSHAYQKAVRSGMAHDAVARDVIGTNIVLIVLAVFSVQHMAPLWQAGFTLSAYALAFMLLHYFASQPQPQEAEPEYTEAEIVDEIPPRDTALPAKSGDEQTA